MLTSACVWLTAQSQLLDEEHLLLSLGALEANAHRAADAGQQYALIVVFNIAEARVTAVFNNSRRARGVAPVPRFRLFTLVDSRHL
jgi:hypothetical protein